MRETWDQSFYIHIHCVALQGWFVFFEVGESVKFQFAPLYDPTYVLYMTPPKKPELSL